MVIELPELDTEEGRAFLRAARVVEADRILSEWHAEGMDTWDRGEATWHDDPGWLAWFALSMELSDLAYGAVDGSFSNPTWAGVVNRIGDRHLIG